MEKLYMSEITNEMITLKYGDRHDGIQVYKGNRAVGYLTDLRRDIFNAKKSKQKAKEYSTKAAEIRKEALPEAVNEMVAYLKWQLSKYDAKVFMNISQPNVHINGCKCYIIVDPINFKHRLGIQNPNRTANEMAEDVESCFKISSSDSPNHILINGMSHDDIVEAIIKLCLSK